MYTKLSYIQHKFTYFLTSKFGKYKRYFIKNKESIYKVKMLSHFLLLNILGMESRDMTVMIDMIWEFIALQINKYKRDIN